MPSKDMSEILLRCRTGDSAAQEPLALSVRRAGKIKEPPSPCVEAPLG